MIASIPEEHKEIDIVIVTPGGIAQQVAKFVNTIRPRFSNVTFILLNMSMSAGTIFVMSGDEIIMNTQSCIGPIDPQVRNKNGEFVPAQSLLTLVEEIRKKGQAQIDAAVQPSWTDIQILRNIDPKEIGNAMSASNYSIQLVQEYLETYKFKTWTNHTNGSLVTEAEKKMRANEIASLLCDHSKWLSHGHAITMDAAWDVCRLKITNAAEIENLDRAMRRMWALFYWIFENMEITKAFVSDNYSLFRIAPSKIKN